MLRSKLGSVILTLSFLVLNEACTAPQIKVYDKEVCAVLGDIEYPVGSGKHIGARCKHTYSPGSRLVTVDAWKKEVVGKLCTDSQGFTDTETAIDQFCSAYIGGCDYEMRERLMTFSRHMRILSVAADLARKHAKIISME